MLALKVPIVSLSQKLHKYENLTDAVYHFEIIIYCDLASDAVARRCRGLKDAFRRTNNLTLGKIDQSRSPGWNRAHAEWQNRGLGGFRAWRDDEDPEALLALSSAAASG